MIIELHPGVPRFDRTLRIDDGDRTLVAVMDGSASWGMGEEAATRGANLSTTALG